LKKNLQPCLQAHSGPTAAWGIYQGAASSKAWDVAADRNPKRTAMQKLNKLQTLQVIANVCQRYGCEIRKVDLDRQILDIGGPDEAQEKCRHDLAVLLD
jgi:hypothetical protein